MTKNKQPPWLDQALEADLFEVNSDEVMQALSLRQEFDYDHGIRFRGEAVKKRDWVVGFLPESRDGEDAMKSVFEIFSKIEGKEVLAIPAEPVESEFSGLCEAVDRFFPPLISKVEASYSMYVKIRASLIQMIHGSFYIFSKSNEFALLVNNGKYAMVAAPRSIVEAILKDSVEASWNSVRVDDQIDQLWLYGLRRAMIAYGMK